jgi:hypothetical protein
MTPNDFSLVGAQSELEHLRQVADEHRLKQAVDLGYRLLEQIKELKSNQMVVPILWCDLKAS